MRLVPFTRKSEMTPITSLFDDFLNSFFDEGFTRETQLLALDVVEENDRYDVRANFPGLSRDDIKVRMHGDTLEIEAVKQQEKEQEEKGVYHLRERFNGHWRRAIRLPETCDTEKISANLKDGVLTLSIPKIEPKPKKEISIE